MNFEAYPVGTRVVLLENEKMIGMIVGHYIGNSCMKYDVEWWEAGDVKCRLFHPFTVKPVDQVATKTIGFKQPEK